MNSSARPTSTSGSSPKTRPTGARPGQGVASLALSCLASLALSGCYAQVTGGYTAPFSSDAGSRGGALRLHLGTNTNQTLFGHPTLREGLAHGMGLNITGRATRDNQQFGPGLEGLLRLVLRSHSGYRGGGVSLMQIYGRPAVALAQLGALDGKFTVSAFSPSFELGTVFRFGHEDVPFWTISAFAERDVRIDAADQTFFGLLWGGGILK